MSPFQFLLSRNKDSFIDICDELFTSEELKPEWQDAFEQCQNYRQHLASLPIDPRLKAKAYLLRLEDIDKLIKQSSGLDAIRIYIGHEIFPDGSRAVRLFTVACKKNASGKYDDWQIPPRINPTLTTELGESRPCPDECGNTNDLNQP